MIKIYIKINYLLPKNKHGEDVVVFGKDDES